MIAIEKRPWKDTEFGCALEADQQRSGRQRHVTLPGNALPLYFATGDTRSACDTFAGSPSRIEEQR
jgi:hypothetical protein